MITVVCCHWGNWPVNGKGHEYVRKLRAAVARNITVPHQFICFADKPVGRINTRPLLANHWSIQDREGPLWRGCIPKTYVYSRAAGLTGRVLLLDLDNVITGSLDDIASYDGDFCVRGSFRYGTPDGDMIAFDAEKCRDIWSALIGDPSLVDEKGRERFFLATRRPNADMWQDVLPGQILSYKRHCRVQMKLPEDARIVSFHGDPRPHEVEDKWVKECWK